MLPCVHCRIQGWQLRGMHPVAGVCERAPSDVDSNVHQNMAVFDMGSSVATHFGVVEIKPRFRFS